MLILSVLIVHRAAAARGKRSTCSLSAASSYAALTVGASAAHLCGASRRMSGACPARNGAFKECIGASAIALRVGRERPTRSDS